MISMFLFENFLLSIKKQVATFVATGHQRCQNPKTKHSFYVLENLLFTRSFCKVLFILDVKVTFRDRF